MSEINKKTNNIYKFLLNSYYFNHLLNQTNIKVEYLINMFKLSNTDYYKDDEKIKMKLYELYKISPIYNLKHGTNPNLNFFLKSLYINEITQKYISVFKNNNYIINCPFEIIEKVYKNINNEFVEYLNQNYLNNISDIQNIHYFILSFNNNLKSNNKFNQLKKLISKLKINNKIFVLTSIYYETNDYLKVEYNNIYDKTDKEYEIRQTKFYLNDVLLSSDEILNNYEEHNGDIEYIKENNYFHRFKYCIYEEYNDKFIPIFEYKDIDLKYSWIGKDLKLD